VSTQIQYYAMVLAGSGGRSASGLARRRYEPEFPVDETLRRDLSWKPDSAIVEWEYGALDVDLIKISEQEAENLGQAFRARWRRAAAGSREDR
jgi:hypothetical protein